MLQIIALALLSLARAQAPAAKTTAAECIPGEPLADTLTGRLAPQVEGSIPAMCQQQCSQFLTVVNASTWPCWPDEFYVVCNQTSAWDQCVDCADCWAKNVNYVPQVERLLADVFQAMAEDCSSAGSPIPTGTRALALGASGGANGSANANAITTSTPIASVSVTGVGGVGPVTVPPTGTATATGVGGGGSPGTVSPSASGKNAAVGRSEGYLGMAGCAAVGVVVGAALLL